jgi:hypothetical protein
MRELKNKTYYDLLQVNPSADTQIIHAAYRALMSSMRKHPDLGGDPEEATTINIAHETLTDPVKRSRYDEELKSHHAYERATSRVAGVDDDERRRVPRHEIDAPVNICVGHDHRWFSGWTIDASLLGMKLQAEKPVRIGQMVTIIGKNSAAQAIHAKVRWARMFHPTIFERIYEFGVEFLEPIDDIETRLDL